jgi:hypothetical protein
MRSSVFWALVLIVAGGLLLLSNLGLLGANPWQLLFPVFLILAGVWFLLRPGGLRGREFEGHVEIPLQGASRARVRIRHGAGRLLLDGKASPGSIVSGEFGGGVRHKERKEGDLLEVLLRFSNEFVWTGPWAPGMTDWNLGVNSSIPLDLQVRGGASQTTLDLSDTRVQTLDVRTGASSTQILLPTQAGRTQVTIRAGAASISLRVPANVGARFWVRRGLSVVVADPSRFPRAGDVYQSPDFETAINRVDTVIDSGVGSIEIH